MMGSYYVVIGNFTHSHKDCEGETQECETYMEALKLKKEWKKSRKYKDVCILKLKFNKIN